MLCLVGVNGMERMKLEEINENWREDWEKNEVVQNCYDKNFEENGCSKE